MTMPSEKSFGVQLRQHRMAAHLTQAELAERASLSARGINDLERGARTVPRPETVRLLADALGLQGGGRSTFFAAARGSRHGPAGEPMPAKVPVAAARTPPPLPSGTVTFLFTDVEGSTRLLQRLGNAYAQVLGEHQRLLRLAWAEHGGVEVDTAGDGFFVAFPTAPAAVAAAVAATRALAAHSWPEGSALRVRIGLHTGSPHLVGDRYVGIDVHRAARIAAAGHGGQILLSASTRVLAAEDLPEGTTLRDLGTYRLKDLQHPESLTQLVLLELPGNFPPLKTLDRRAHNLPIQPTALLGREEHVETLAGLLGRVEVRLVTVTGAAGIGKTRLALQVAAEVLEDFADGVWFVRLSRLSDPDLVLPTIAQTLALKEVLGQPIAQTLSEYLREKQLLLMLDNFEQVVAAAPEIGELLAQSSGLKMLVTSRVPLRLRGERDYAVGPLSLPEPGRLPPPEQLTQYAAVALFVERASAVRSDFTVTAGNAPAISQICSRLDGLPLAIELAAVRVKLLPPEALLTRLNSQLKLLTGGARDLEVRQQTMRATIAWSEQLLRPAERALFRRLAVFVGGATLEAVEAICLTPKASEPLEIDALDGLGALVDHRLVQQREEGGEPRFGMMQVIREYALELMEAHDGGKEAEGLRSAHLAYYLAMAERRETDLFGTEAEAWLERFEQEHDNIRAALARARQQVESELGLRLAGALVHAWEATGYYSEGRGWLQEFLSLAAPAGSGQEDRSEGDVGGSAATPAVSTVSPMALAKALCGVGVCAYRQKDYDPALAALAASLELAHDRSPGWVAGLAVHLLGMIALERGDLERARACVSDSVERALVAGEPGLAASFTLELGNIAQDRGDLEQAAAYFEDGLALAQRAGAEYAAGDALGDLADIARRLGDLARAERLGREQLLAWRRLGVHGYLAARGLENLALIAASYDDGSQAMRAARLWGAAAALCEQVGAPPQQWHPVDTKPAIAAARAALGEEAWATAFAAGNALSLDEAMAEALTPIS